jgi:mono/diheme cytochrome c family protein
MRFPAIMVLCGVTVIGAMVFSSPQPPAQGDDLIARGRYLVGAAGQCADCHGANLHGQFLFFMKPGMPVAYHSANIAGLKQMSAAAAVTFFETGKLPNGKSAAPPMPQYRFNASDAAAIVAYLKSLK